jgi:hypothetical protein
MRHGQGKGCSYSRASQRCREASRTTSSEVLSWRHPLALHHFLEGVQERCSWQAPRQALHQQLRPARRCRATTKALPFSGKEVRTPLPLVGREAYSIRNPSLAGKRRLTREGISPSREKEACKRRLGIAPEKSRMPCTWQPNPMKRSLVSPRAHAWRTRGGSPLPRTCRRHHYCGTRGNDGQDRLVEFHQRSASDGVKYSMVYSPVGLRNHPKLCDICRACNLATVGSPCV